jgi:hypothetical protein
MKRHRETRQPFGRTTLPILLVGVCVWSTACDETLTSASPELPAPQFKKGGGKPSPPNLQGAPLDAIFRDASGDRLRSDGLGTYSSGTEDTYVLLRDGYIEFRLDQGGARRFYIGPGDDADHLTDGAFADTLAKYCGGSEGGNPCTGKGLIGGFTLWEGNQELEGRFLGVTLANSGLVTAEMTAAWEAGNYRWHLKYGQDCSYDAVDANRLTVTVLTGSAGEIAGWAVETDGPEPPKAILCRIPQRGKRVAESMGEFVAPVRLELRYQTNP